MWEKINCEFYVPEKNREKIQKYKKKLAKKSILKNSQRKLKWSIKEKLKKNHQKIFPNIKNSQSHIKSDLIIYQF